MSGASGEFTSRQRIFGAGEWSLEQLCCSSAVVTMGRPSFLSSLKLSSFFLPCKDGFGLQSFSFCPSLWEVFLLEFFGSPRRPWASFLLRCIAIESRKCPPCRSF